MRGSLLLGVLALGAPFVVAAALFSDPPEPRVEPFVFTDRAIVESSGLALLDDLVVTVNDSGDTGRVFAVDPATGDTVGTTSFSEDPVDIEAIASAGEGEVWVADIGDNRARRDSVTLTRVPVGRGDRVEPGESWTLTYADGPHNAETLLVHPSTGQLFVVTKGVFGGRVYAAPQRLRQDGPNVLRAGEPALGMATDGAFFPDGEHVVVRDYSKAVVYDWPSMREVTEIPLPRQEQGEGLAVTPDHSLLISSEGVDQPVLEVPLPEELLLTPDPTPDPAATTESRADDAADPAEQSDDGNVVAYLVGGGVVAVLVALAVRRWRHGAERRPR